MLRPVVLVHVIDDDTGREQMLALTESSVPPRIEPWTLEDARRGMRLQAFSGAEVMNQRAERMPAKAPTVARRPGYPSGSNEIPKVPKLLKGPTMLSKLGFHVRLLPGLT